MKFVFSRLTGIVSRTMNHTHYTRLQAHQMRLLHGSLFDEWQSKWFELGDRLVRTVDLHLELQSRMQQFRIVTNGLSSMQKRFEFVADVMELVDEIMPMTSSIILDCHPYLTFFDELQMEMYVFLQGSRKDVINWCNYNSY